ncbi:MAG: M23 family metallopeptidase [Anaerolineae bacterium]|nr:M23 family metallopeptidase [Anaerolineae bacterium]
MGISLLSSPITIGGSSGGRAEPVTYVVQQGDTLNGLADRFGLDLCTLIWSNPARLVSPLRVGRTIDIPHIDGVFYRVTRNITIQALAEELKIAPAAIIEEPYNRLEDASPETVLVEGMKVMAPGADGGLCAIWAPPASVSGGAGSSGSVGGGGGGLWGCSYTVAAASLPVNNPVQGRYTFWQDFTTVHSGVDLAASSGTPVSAAGAGTVAYSGWNDWGYGEVIVIDHGGTFSLYAHMLSGSRAVGCGEAVFAGQHIGMIGSTGRSSGPHLHFEVRDAEFNPVDPKSYMPF